MIDLFLTHLAAGGRSRATVEQRRYQLLRLERDLPQGLRDATTAELERFLSRPEWSREYRRSARSVITSFYSWAVAAGHLSVNPALDLPRVKAAPPKPRPAPDIAYFHALEKAPARERLMLRLAAEAGLRRAEVAGIKTSDVYHDLVGYSILVHGKGDKDRLVPVSDSLAREIQCYAETDGYVFPGRYRGHITPGAVGRMVSALLPPGVTMHALRHRYATRVYAASHDILATQQLLGHSSPAITQRYVAVDNERLRVVAAAA